MSVSAGNYLITLEPSTFLINISYTEVIIKIPISKICLEVSQMWLSGEQPWVA